MILTMATESKRSCGMCIHFRECGYKNWGECTAPLPRWAEMRAGAGGSVYRNGGKWDLAPDCMVYEFDPSKGNLAADYMIYEFDPSKEEEKE